MCLTILMVVGRGEMTSRMSTRLHYLLCEHEHQTRTWLRSGNNWQFRTITTLEGLENLEDKKNGVGNNGTVGDIIGNGGNGVSNNGKGN